MSATELRTVGGPLGSLHRKLREVGQAIGTVEKTGRNDFQHYDYVEADHLFRVTREQLLERGVLFSTATVPGSLQHFTDTGGKGFVTTIDLRCTFTDTETGATEGFDFTGAGADVGGDKGLYKAITGGRKYALLAYFNLSTGDDPEADRVTETGQGDTKRGGTVEQDAERPAAPRIPVDRAKAILDQATELGLANEDGTFTPVFKAALAQVGVRKIGALNVDQAEEVEAFLKAEVEA